MLAEAVARAREELGEAGERIGWVAGDVREPGGAESLVASGARAPADGSTCSSTTPGGQFFSPAELIASKGWRAVWRLNVGGMLNMSEAAHRLAFAPAGAGRVINVTLSPHHGMPGNGSFGRRPGDCGGAHE